MSMRQILRKVAKENGVTLAEVRAEMQAAIDVAYQSPPEDGGVTRAYQQRVPHKGETPTPEELIRYSARQIQKNRRQR